MDFTEWKGVSVLSKRVLDACCGSRMLFLQITENCKLLYVTEENFLLNLT